ncbi:response regulator [Lyngbya confervoides]|uniref:Response regulator n=1 Tax=Lyngbya confervoides BDU141951 TaxID=1574623 RepID=A0ABD4T193_9CYAN|nr:response regulator [Lyngbya confervoides]MCM1982536.1 response regulator [Lyngbya confervoides BDU141951]
MTQVFNNPLLIVEDSDEDFVVLERLMQQMSVQNPIYRCLDGDEALDFIFGEGDSSSLSLPQRPAVILLDLNLPGTDGREVLEQIKQHESSTDIPVVIFTTSNNPQDVEFCYLKGANGYLIKPVSYPKLVETIQAFVDYWLRSNVIPQEGLRFKSV